MEHVKAMMQLLARGEVGPAFDEARRHYGEGDGPEDLQNQVVVKALDQLYSHLTVAPVHAFFHRVAEELKTSQAEAVRHALEARLRDTGEWAEILAAIRRERLARELRAAVRGNRLKEAALRVRAMTDLAAKDKNSSAVIGYLGSTLGTLDHDQDKVDKILQAVGGEPARFGLTEAQAEALAQARDRQYAGLASMPLEGREREFTRALTQGIVELRNSLTLEMAAGEPTDEETAGFSEQLHAIFRALSLAGHADGLIDGILLLVEITPRDPRAVGPAVAGEERLFLRLNPRQKLCAVRALRSLAEIPPIPKWFLEFADTSAAQPYLIPLVEVMGGIGCREFYDVIVRTWHDKSVADPRFSCIDALGRIEQEKAMDLLMRRFAHLVQSRPFDPPKRREAEAISTALGRIARGRSVSPLRRNAIVKEAIHHVPKSDTQMGLRAAMDFFSFKPDDLEEGLIVWAVERIVQALWSQDPRPEEARGGEGRAAILGFREGMVDLATRLGGRGQQTLLAAVEPFSSRFSGAFYAVGEILERIGDESSLPMLKKLVLNAWMASDEAASKYARETYHDPADGVVKPITRDKVIHALLFAISKVGGKPGRAFLVETARQVRAKQLDVPGEETGSFLMAELMTHGPEADQERARDRAAGPSHSAPGPGAVDNPFAAAPIERAMEALQARYFLAKSRREKKIPAMQEIARRGHAEALDLLTDQLAEKDPLIRSAAVTAIQEFGAPGVREATQRRLGDSLLRRLGGGNPDERQIARQLLIRLNPRREPYRSQILSAYQTRPGGALKAELSRIIRTCGLFEGAEPGPGGELLLASGERGSSGAKAKAAAAQSEKPSKAGLTMEARRQYFLARKAWIAGGKKGEAPQPPKEA